MAFTLEITTGTTARSVTIDPEQITLGFLEDIEEAQATNKWAPIRSAVAELFHLTREESRQITIAQFKQIGAALQSAVESQTAIPNG